MRRESTDTGPMSTILVVDDEAGVLDTVSISLGEFYKVRCAASGKEALEILRDDPEVALAIIDQRMPEMTGTQLIRRTIDAYPNLVRVILTAYTDVDSLIEAINAGGVYRYLCKPWNKRDLLAVVGDGLELHQHMLQNLCLQAQLRETNAQLAAENAHLAVENSALKSEVRGCHRFEGLVGNSRPWQQVLHFLDKAIASDATVLITGESGTGKELVAKAVHHNGARAAKPFTAVNCADFAAELLGSELFGHKRGAFSGATEDRPGIIRASDGGTVFLDEIGDCPPAVQSMLLRFLAQGEIRPVGSDQIVKVDVRILGATNRDLEADIKAGRFRLDLFHRLNVLPLALPPLRARRDDIPILAHYFLERTKERANKHVRGFAPEAIAFLSEQPFEGNVRELENLVERAVALADHGAVITPNLFLVGDSESFANREEGGLKGMLEAFEKEIIKTELARQDGNQTKAARALGIGRRAFVDKLGKYGLTNAQRNEALPP